METKVKQAKNVDKRLDDSIRSILSRITNVADNNYNISTKDGKLNIHFNRNKHEDYTFAEKLGYLVMFGAIVFGLVTIVTHVFYLMPLVMILVLLLWLIPFNTIINPVKKAFFQRILVPFLLIICIFSGCLAWNRMNRLYVSNANITQTEAKKVHENVPSWVYEFKF